MSTEKLPYVFFGSPPIGNLALEALQAAHYPPTYSITDPKMSIDDMLTIIEEQQPTFLLVVGFGSILKRRVLDTVAGQVLNIHPSYLPEYRGPAPVVQTLLDGATETGVTLMEIDTQMDHGPILAQERLPLRGDETPEELYKVLATKGVHLFLENVDAYLNETLDLLPQNHLDATITHFVKKEDGLLQFSLPADHLERMVRAYQGWPRTWVNLGEKRLLIDKAHLENEQLVLDQVQPQDGKPMSFKAYCAGQRRSPDDVMQEIARQNP
jgi:methionyl-tRNA formyltransferase